jgi:hypothetical protein
MINQQEKGGLVLDMAHEKLLCLLNLVWLLLAFPRSGGIHESESHFGH